MRSRFGPLAGIVCLAVLLLLNADRLPLQGSGEAAMAAESRLLVQGRRMPWPQLAPGSILRARSEHFDFYTRGSGLPMPLGELELASEQVYAYVTDRFAAALQGRIAVIFEPPVTPCGLRGFASIESPAITIKAGAETQPSQYLGVLAHELGHVVELFAYGADAGGDVVLLEAVATWGAGEYWNAWQGWPAFDGAVAAAVDARQDIVLDRPNVKGLNGALEMGAHRGCERDFFYTQWAGFIDYLVGEAGLARLHDLLLFSGLPRMDEGGEGYIRADYASVYGVSLDELNEAWLAGR